MSRIPCQFCAVRRECLAVNNYNRGRKCWRSTRELPSTIRAASRGDSSNQETHARLCLSAPSTDSPSFQSLTPHATGKLCGRRRQKRAECHSRSMRRYELSCNAPSIPAPQLAVLRGRMRARSCSHPPSKTWPSHPARPRLAPTRLGLTAPRRPHPSTDTRQRAPSSSAAAAHGAAPGN